MKNKKILITGGYGFVGVNLVRYILDKTNWEIWILDNLKSGKKEYLKDVSSHRINFIKGDIRNIDDIKKTIVDCNFVVNLAAQVGVIPSIEDPFFDMDVNINGTVNLLYLSKENGVEKFIQASSAAPLGEQKMPLNENKIPKPLSPYGASKLAGEGYCSAFSESFDLKTVVLRFSNVYGPYSKHKNSVIPLFIRQIMNGETLTIYGDGNQTRDFVYVTDICQGILLSLKEKLTDNFNMFQLGTGKEISIDHLLYILRDIFKNKKITIYHTKKRKGEIRKNYTEINRASKLISYKPRISFEDGLRYTIDWFNRI